MTRRVGVEAAAGALFVVFLVLGIFVAWPFYIPAGAALAVAVLVSVSGGAIERSARGRPHH